MRQYLNFQWLDQRIDAIPIVWMSKYSFLSLYLSLSLYLYLLIISYEAIHLQHVLFFVTWLEEINT